MAITLKPITKDNWETCIDLKVSDDQKNFVASNVYSLAQVQFLSNFEAVGIYDDTTMVGFAMYGLDEDDNNYWIYRLMVAEKFQGKGYGKAGLTEIIHRLRDKPDCYKIIIGYHPDNSGAERLYYRTGFKDAGLAPWGEKLVSYKL